VVSQVLRRQFLQILSSGNLKGKVYKNNPHSIVVLQNEMTRVLGSIAVDGLQKESHNLFMRCKPCLQAEGGQFQHVINHGKFVLSFYSILINVCM
jgi:hypothetical protein